MKTKAILALSLACLSLQAAQPRAYEPAYTPDGRLTRPDNYREWIYLSSGLGMTYGLAEAAVNGVLGQRFDNVFVTPEAYAVFRETGAWPDKTVFVKEVRAAGSKGSLNKGGHYQQELVEIEVHIKDQSHFASKWEFFVFDKEETAKPLGAKSTCHACHSQNGAVDETFVQFYPTLLPVAHAHGTLQHQAKK